MAIILIGLGVIGLVVLGTLAFEHLLRRPM